MKTRMNRTVRRKEIYNEYIERHQKNIAQYEPTLLSFEKATEYYNLICGKNSPEKIRSNCNAHKRGMIRAYCGLYKINDKYIEFIYYRENNGGLANYVAYEYTSKQAHEKYEYPLSQHYYFNR